MNNNEISLLDVKELYDAAYAEKNKSAVNLDLFRSLMSRADALAEKYYAQLRATAPAYSMGRAV